MQQQNEKKTNQSKIIDSAVFALLLVAVSAVTLYLFHRQTLGNPESYHSDMKAYILEMQGLDSGYSFPYPVFFKIAAFLNWFTTPEFAVALTTMLLNSLAMVITKLALNRMFADRTRYAGVLVSFTTVSLFFISMLYPPTGIYLPGIQFKYLGVFTANPFHNATYMAARPFAILAFLWFVKLLPVYEKGVRKADRQSASDERSAGGCVMGRSLQGACGEASIGDYLLFSLFLLLATMTKPSFTIVLVGTAGLIMLFRLFCSKFKNLVPTVQLGLCFIPTFIDLLYQYSGVFVPDEGVEGGMGFCFGEVWGYYCGNIPLAICLAIGFPLLVLVLNLREIRRNTGFRFAWQLYGMSFLMAFLLYEKGFRKPDFNFSWGYMYGIFFCHLGAVSVLLKDTLSGEKDKKKPLLLGMQWLAYLAHLICGLLYFKTFLSGGMYY